MQTMIEQGVYLPARQIPSPNFNERPPGAEISLLVIHNISLPPNEFGGGYVEQFFTNQLSAEGHPFFASIAQMQVSAHFYIDRTGAVVQFVNMEKRAWHAGRSVFEGREECNDFSVGIELEGCDTCAFSEHQYPALIALSSAIMQTYPKITPDRIVGHSDIAPGRKTDPGPFFEWDHYRQSLLKLGATS